MGLGVGTECPSTSVRDYSILDYWGKLHPEPRAGFYRPARRHLDKSFQTLLSEYLHSVAPPPRLVCEASWANRSNLDMWGSTPCLWGFIRYVAIYRFSKQAFPISENRSLKAQLPLIPLFSLPNCPLLLLPVSLFTGLFHICVSSDFIVGGSRGAVVQYPADRYSKEYAIMAHNSIWQLKKLVVRYCDWGGSSRGIREFIQSHLPSFQKNNPQVEVVTEMMRGKHPHLRGYYRCSTVRMVDSRNVDAKDILLQAIRLRNALGLKVTKLKTRHLITRQSVQGTWKTGLRFWS